MRVDVHTAEGRRQSLLQLKETTLRPRFVEACVYYAIAIAAPSQGQTVSVASPPPRFIRVECLQLAY